jgi:hypothetical protein
MLSSWFRPSLVGTFSLTLFCSFISQCPTPVQITLPAAQTPILETILDIDHSAIAPFGPAGVFQMLPGRRIELRFRAPYPTNVGVGIDTQMLTQVSDTAAHPELDGYFHVQDTVPVSAPDPNFFWRVLVILPAAQQGAVNYTISIANISQDQNLTGTQKIATPAAFSILRLPNPTAQPSTVLFPAGNTIPDQKHPRDGPDRALILDHITLAGWLVSTPLPAGSNDAEDLHYGIWLDNDFIERNYQATTDGLNTASMPGRWYTWGDNVIHPKQPIPLTGGAAPNAGTFLTVGHAADNMNVELNAWHKSSHAGQTPPGWIPNPDPAAPDIVWPFDVQRPFNLTSDLQADDYVILSGALVEDSGHLHEDTPHTPEYWRSTCWDDHYKSHGGWLEIHPLDSIRRVPPPLVRKHPQVLQVCDNGRGQTPTAVDMDIPAQPPAPPTDYSQLRFREIVDDRFTDIATVNTHVVEVDPCDPTQLHVQVKINAQGHFKAVYLVWWQEESTKRPPHCKKRPQGKPEPEQLGICSRKPSLPQCKHIND